MGPEDVRSADEMFHFICEAGHRLMSSKSNLEFCSVPEFGQGTTLKPCGAPMDYRIIDYVVVNDGA